MFRILVINPGSTSTKTAVYEDEHCRWETVLVHPDDQLASFSPVTAQLDYRLSRLSAVLTDKGFEPEGFAAVVARGGLLRPLAGGVYLVDREMEDDLAANRFGEHASNLGAIMARRLAARAGLPAFTVDPVSVDELDGVARFSGLKGLPRVSLSHALNNKAVAREVSARLGRDYTDVNLVVVHLGSGISVSAHRGGRMVDVNNAGSEGPFSLERCGTLPALALIELCCSRQCRRAELAELVTRKGGLYSYLGTRELRRVEEMVAAGDGEAAEVVAAMVYQVSKEIGAMAAVLTGRVDRVVLTGGMAHSRLITAPIAKRVSFIAPVEVLPGEREMEALALGILRVLRGREQALAYGRG
ncbi:MAG: butyrate kinase [Candidatus Desulforudis sp.]|nr:butyrate kinase [Desulforudis sp.]